MKKFSTWMLVMFMVMFWIFRIIVTLTSELNIDFAGMVPLNREMEIALLFAFLVCIILVVKRSLIGGLLYLLLYGMYFGKYLFNNISTIIESQGSIGMYMNTFVSLIGMIIPVAVLIDLLADKGRKNNPKDKKTDWFYDNEDYDRKMDERADKNNYRTL